MASAVSRQCPGRNGVFIRGISIPLSGIWPGADCAGAGFSRCCARRRSPGFSASAGMAQDFPNFCAPGIRPWVHSCCTVRGASPHFSAACCTVRDSISSPPYNHFQFSLYARSRVVARCGAPFAAVQGKTFIPTVSISSIVTMKTRPTLREMMRERYAEEVSRSADFCKKTPSNHCAAMAFAISWSGVRAAPLAP